MFNQHLRNQDEIFFSGKLDIVRILKKDNRIQMEKTRSGIFTWIYFFFFLTAAVLIGVFCQPSSRFILSILAGAVVLSVAAILFWSYKGVIDFQKQKIFLSRRIFFLEVAKNHFLFRAPGLESSEWGNRVSN